MKNLFRLALLSAASVAALAFAASAMASYSPVLVVGAAGNNYRQTATPTAQVLIAQGRTDDPTAKVSIYSPPGYSVSLAQAPGTTIGRVDAAVIALDLTGPNGNPIPLRGPVVVDSPSKYTSNPCSPGLHQAVWVLQASVAGQTVPIPVYVDKLSGPQATIGSALLQVCLAPPDVPSGTPGRSPFGSKLVSALFTAAGVFTNPTVRGLYPWRAVFTPYSPGTGRPNAAGTKEAEGVVPIPYSISFARLKARRGVRFGGTVYQAARPLAKARVAVYSSSLAELKKGIDHIFGTARTNAKGKFTLARRTPKRTTVFYAERPVTSTTCASPSLGGVPCTSALITPIDSRDVTVKVKARRK